jgi:hypothetical protein
MCSAWTAKANKRVQFGYGLNYLIDIANAIIVDVEPTPARTMTRLSQRRRCSTALSSILALEAEAACGRYGLRDWPLPGLVGWPQDCTVHPGPRCQRARRWHIIAPRLSRSDCASQVLLYNVGPALDAAMFSDTAAVTEERPAGLLNGIAALTPTAAVAGIKAEGMIDGTRAVGNVGRHLGLAA